jgi:hypothetical protein
MPNGETYWVVRITPAPGFTVQTLLAMPLGLDVWESHDDFLIVRASDPQLAEIERRRLALVERLEQVSALQGHPDESPGQQGLE